MQGASDWIYLYPQGIEELLIHMKSKYNNPMIYITENGILYINEDKLYFFFQIIFHVLINQVTSYLKDFLGLMMVKYHLKTKTE